MAKTLALIHTTHVLIPAFMGLFKKLIPELEVFNIVDESLLKNTMKAQQLTPDTVRRLINYVRSTKDAGADAVMVTCSSIGPAVDAARAVIDIPIFRIDEAMADEAVTTGRRLAVVATLRSTLEPTAALLKVRGARLGRDCEILTRLCDGAFEAVASGDAETHDRIVLSALNDLMEEVDVVVLAQASMARVAEKIPAAERKVPILSSPELAVRRAQEVIRQYLSS